MVKRVIEIFEKYDTDKNSKGHNYGPYYAQHLPKTAKKILEIGVYKGESARAWHEIYPEAHVYGLDLYSEHEPIKESWFTPLKGNQADSKILDDVRCYGPFDFITEDGSHNSRHQLMTFYGLVGTTPLYIVEDLQCCTEAFYRQGMNVYNTMLGQMVGGVFPHQFTLLESKIAFIYAS
jgi:hypothetical protein